MRFNVQETRSCSMHVVSMRLHILVHNIFISSTDMASGKCTRRRGMYGDDFFFFHGDIRVLYIAYTILLKR